MKYQLHRQRPARATQKARESWPSVRAIALRGFFAPRSIEVKGLNVGAVDGLVASGCPAGADAHVAGVIDVANVNISRAARARPGHLRMAAKAKVGIANGEQLVVDRTVRIMAGRATFAQGRVLEREGARLFLMALRAIFIQARHREAAAVFHDVHAVRVVALDAIHFSFENGMMLRKMKLGLGFQMAIETSLGIFAGINDESPTRASRGDVLAAGAVTGFATAPAFHGSLAGVQAAMDAHRENAINFFVAIRARLVTDVIRAFNRQGRDDLALRRRAGVDQQKQRDQSRAQCQSREIMEATGF